MIRDCFGASLADSTATPPNHSAWLGGYQPRVPGFITRAWPAICKTASVRTSVSSIPDYLVASYAHQFIEVLIARCAASKATPAFPIRSPIEFHCFSESSCFKYDAVDKRFSEVESVVDGNRPGTVGTQRPPVVEVDRKVPPLNDV